MPAAPARSALLHPLEPDELARLVAALLGSDVADDGPHLVRARLADGDVELAIRSTGGDHPAVHLPGLVAADDWLAVGVCARGRARSLDDAPTTAGRPVRTAHLVGSDGAWASAWQPDDGPGGGTASGLDGDAGLPSGRVDDLCRRAFALPTPPPTTGTAQLWSTLWLDRVLTLAAATAGQATELTREQLARLHPACRGSRRRVASWTGLADRAADLAAERSWSDVRRAVAAGTLALDGVPPGLAAWHDDGSFSRCCLAAWPDLADLRDAVAALLPPTTVTGIDDVLAAG